jgi:hypothetical protein
MMFRDGYRVSTCDELRSALAGHIIPALLEHHDEFVLKPNQVVDVDEQPEQAGGQASKIQRRVPGRYFPFVPPPRGDQGFWLVRDGSHVSTDLPGMPFKLTYLTRITLILRSIPMTPLPSS